MRNVLTIAGFDPSSGAGITADLMVFAAHQLFGTACITALTVQSTVGVVSISPVPAPVVRATLECLQEDLPAAGIKIGMLAEASVVAVVIEFLRELRSTGSRIPIVLDPVLRSTSGMPLLDSTGTDLLRSKLLPLVSWVTPNLRELANLLGLPEVKPAEAPEAARQLQAIGGELAVLVTGGDCPEPHDLLLVPAGDPLWLPGRHIETTATHGTGCAFSSSLLSRLVHGDGAEAAASAAKAYVARAMQTAEARGRGKGPLHHLWTLTSAEPR